MMTGVDIGGKIMKLDLTRVRGSSELKDKDLVITKNPYTGLLFQGCVEFDSNDRAWVMDLRADKAPYRIMLTKGLFQRGVYRVSHKRKSSI